MSCSLCIYGKVKDAPRDKDICLLVYSRNHDIFSDLDEYFQFVYYQDENSIVKITLKGLDGITKEINDEINNLSKEINTLFELSKANKDYYDEYACRREYQEDRVNAVREIDKIRWLINSLSQEESFEYIYGILE